jgi:hypothetical protein
VVGVWSLVDPDEANPEKGGVSADHSSIWA